MPQALHSRRVAVAAVESVPIRRSSVAIVSTLVDTLLVP